MAEENYKPFGRPSKIGVWIVAFEKIVEKGFNAIYLTDTELRMLTNDLVAEKDQICEATFKNWKAGGLKDPIYLNFLALYKKALTSQKLELFNKLESDPDKWQRYAWIIERKFTDWNLRTKVEKTIKVEQPLFGEAPDSEPTE